MDNALRHAWTKLITAADLDDHMAQVGQARANAELLQSILDSSAREKPVSLLIAGAGTAQFLDYIPATCLTPFHLTLSDINESFLKRAEERCDRAGLSDARFVVDDIEVTQLMGPYQVIAVTLVLEHIDWRRGLRGIHRLAPNHLHIVIQCNPEGLVEAIAPGRKLNLSMQAFADFAHPILVPSEQLIDFLGRLGYRLTAQQDRRVADNKTMLALSFKRD